MTAPYSISTQNTNKCPHGFPLGACPICSGMAGGKTKDRDTPRKAGEMTYNECLAQWHKMLAKQDLKSKENKNQIKFIQEIQTKIQNQIHKLMTFEKKIMNAINTSPIIIKTPIKIVIKIINKIIQTVSNFSNNFKNFFQNIKTDIIKFISLVSEKITSIFGEIKNFIETNFQKIILKPITTMLSLLSEKKEEEKDKKRKNLKDILKKILKINFKDKNEN